MRGMVAGFLIGLLGLVVAGTAVAEEGGMPKLLGEYRGAAGPVGRVAVDPTGALLAGAAEGVVWVWEKASGRRVCTWRPRGGIRLLQFAPDGRSVMVAGDRVTWWDARRGRLLRSLPVRADAASEDGRLLAKAGATTVVYDARTGRVVGRFKLHDEAGLNLGGAAFSPDGKFLVVGGSTFSPSAPALPDDGSMWLVDLGRKKVDQDTIEFSVWAFAFAPGMERPASGGRTHPDEGVAWVRVPGQAEALCRPSTPLKALAYNRDGRFLAVLCDDLEIWGVQDRKVRWRLGKGAVSVAFDRGKEQVLTGGIDRVVRLWELGE